MSSNSRKSLRSSQDPIDVELTEVARESFTASSNGSSSREHLHGKDDNMFPYGSAAVDDDDNDAHDNEEDVIDILANVDRDTMLEEHMVTHQEDSLTKTIAGVAGNVLEWYDFAGR